MPAEAWIREYPQRVTSEDTPEPREADSPTSPTVRQMGATYGFGRFVVAPLARMIYRPRIEGKANVPKTGPVIFASNHLSFIDSIAIPVAAPRPVHFLAKSSYFDGAGFSGWFSREFFTAIGAVPVQRGAGQAALDALDQQRQLLDEGSAVALYPEGTRSLDGRLYKGRTGVAFLALQTGAPVVPVGLIGTDTVMPVGAKHALAASSASPSSSANRSISPTTGRPNRARPAASPPTTSWRPSTRSPARSSRTPTTRRPRTARSSGSSRCSRTSAASAQRRWRPRPSARAARGSSPSSR